MIAASCLTFVSPCFVHQIEMVDLGNFFPSSAMGSDYFKMFRVRSSPHKAWNVILFYEGGTEAQIILGWSTLNSMCLSWQISWLPDNPIWGSGWNMLQFPPSPSVSVSFFSLKSEGEAVFHPPVGLGLLLGDFDPQSQICFWLHHFKCPLTFFQAKTGNLEEGQK